MNTILQVAFYKFYLRCGRRPSRYWPPIEAVALSGGVVASTNLTPDPDVGLGKWTDDEIKSTITSGIDKFGGKLTPPMPWHFFAGMHPADLDAIVAYLRTLKAVVQK